MIAYDRVGISLNNISNVLRFFFRNVRCMYGRTHMSNETTSHKRKCGKKVGNIYGGKGLVREGRHHWHAGLGVLLQSLAMQPHSRSHEVVSPHMCALPHKCRTMYNVQNVAQINDVKRKNGEQGLWGRTWPCSHWYRASCSWAHWAIGSMLVLLCCCRSRVTAASVSAST